MSYGPAIMTKTSFAEKLARLRTMFLAQMQEDIPQLQAYQQQLMAAIAAQQTDTAELLIALHHLLHKIKGSAGTFGYTELSDCAQRLEAYIKAWQQHGLPSESGEQNDFQQDYNNLLALHEQLQHSTPTENH